jgi:hypothetical protein
MVRTPAAQVVDESIVVLQDWTKQKCHDMRQREREILGQRGVRGLIGGRQNCPGKPADVRAHGEAFRCPCSGSIGEAKGERKRMPRAIYRHREESKRASNQSN